MEYDREVLQLFLCRLGGISRHFWLRHSIASRFSAFGCTVTFYPFRGVQFELVFDDMPVCAAAKANIEKAIGRVRSEVAASDVWAASMLKRLDLIEDSEPRVIRVRSSMNDYGSTLLIDRILCAICGLGVASFQ